MVKSAVLVGCNYPGTKNELHGCVNDVVGMYKMLLGKFGFAAENVSVLIDTNSDFPLPTGENIRKALLAMVQGAKPGDTFFFHFSGHGIRIPVDAGEVDDTGFDECICPCDCNFIEDDDFRDLISMLPAGTTFTVVSDSCQSGGLIDQAKEQIGNSFDQLTMAEVAPDPLAGNGGTPNGTGEQKIVKKELSAESVVEILRERSGREDIEVTNLRSTMWEMFGEQASSKVKKEVKGIGTNTSRSVPAEPPAKNKSKGSGGKKGKAKKGRDSSSSSEEGESDEESVEEDNTYDKRRSRGVNYQEEGSAEEADEEEEEEGSADEVDEEADEEEGSADEVDEDEEESPDVDDEAGYGSQDIDAEIAATYAHVEPISGTDGNVGVLVSGCQSHQTSADVRANPPHGALTNGIITVLQMLEPGEPITNRQLVMRLRRYLASHGLTQEPGLYCSDEKANQPFICTPVN